MSIYLSKYKIINKHKFFIMAMETLIVDDDLVFILIHKNLLKLCEVGSQFTNCLDGQEALKYLDKEKDESKHYLILLDIKMPIMNGWKFLDAIQDRPYQHNLSVVILTSSTNIEDRQKAVTYSQVIHYIEKPLTVEGCQQIKSLENVKKYLKN
mgnify:CR=1 FL=1